jgi:hypothetical protein
MDVVHAIKPLPSDVRKAIQKINAVRNAFAHSFFPENRKEHRKNKKVLYGGTDIRTQQGLYQSSVSLTRWGLNEAAIAASKLVAELGVPLASRSGGRHAWNE